MGVWGYGPFDNDYALDWVQGVVRQTVYALLLGKIEEYFTEGYRTEVLKYEAESAAALLLLFCDPDCRTIPGLDLPGGVTLFHLAKTREGLDPAIRTLESLLADENWIRDYSEPELKIQVLQQMLDVLRKLRDKA